MVPAGEVFNFTKVWLSVFISLSYCYAISKVTPKGFTGLFCVLPIICLFLFLPLKLSSIHLGGMTAFFLAWLTNFKLLLFAFGKGPLSSSNPPLSLPRFIAMACLPIKIQQNPLSKSRKGHKSPLNYAIKCLLLAALLQAYNYNNYLHPKLILVLYSFHIFFVLELTLAMVQALVRALFGLELEPQFDEPYLATSLQDFWGRRWNLMVTRILRPTVHEPVLYISARAVGRKWAPLPAVFSTFLVSAAMHELIFYYLGRVRPTWEITWFFVFHGMCLMAEIALKKVWANQNIMIKSRLITVLRTMLTVGFVMVTSFWWFFPTLLRCNTDVRAFEEYAAVGAFVKDFGRALTFSPS
ncbi:acyl-CoA--sterol O-acyltransferase 1-like [Pistacia vera]|uniref:acyl-CoA--sterol O-acyltransferase 1-like n=1 Tax=Pistacia vera TaxID=55513 RepID=UPI00126322A6|nr:acyl-CoA--sterol O-acyltransferase 1-like [Pistacia vera]